MVGVEDVSVASGVSSTMPFPFAKALLERPMFASSGLAFLAGFGRAGSGGALGTVTNDVLYSWLCSCILWFQAEQGSAVTI